MTSIIDASYFDQVLNRKTIALGELFFFKDFLVAEFNEGVNIDFESFKEAKTIINSYYGDKDFGFISNRMYSYSIVITDAPRFNASFPNLKAYATVTYSTFASKVFEMENHFFKFNRKNFSDLDDAISWVKNTLKNEVSTF